MKDLHTKLFYLRTLANWTQEHVANKIGVSKTIYLEIEKNASRTTIERLNRIVSLYGITLENFFSFRIADIYALIKGEAPDAMKMEFAPQVLASLDAIIKLLHHLAHLSLRDLKKHTDGKRDKEAQKDQRPSPAFRAII